MTNQSRGGRANAPGSVGPTVRGSQEAGPEIDRSAPADGTGSREPKGGGANLVGTVASANAQGTARDGRESAPTAEGSAHHDSTCREPGCVRKVGHPGFHQARNNHRWGRDR